MHKNVKKEYTDYKKAPKTGAFNILTIFNIYNI